MPAADQIRESMTRASWIRKMFEKGAELKREHGPENVFDFSLGNPVLEPPKQFYETLANVAKRRSEGLHRYMPNAGFPSVRDGIARKLSEEGTFLGMDASGVVMTVGAGGALNCTLKAILNPQDEVIILAPYFVEYRFYIHNHGGVPVVVETSEDFNVDPEAIAEKITPKTKAIIINSPNNPTGRIYGPKVLEALAQVLVQAESRFGAPIYLISDEPYREIVYTETPPRSPAHFHAHSFLVYSWSKSLSIPGERIGYVAVNPATDTPRDLADALTFANRTLGFVNAPATMQLVAGELLSVTVDVEWYRKKRDRLVSALTEMGFEVPANEGSFYLFPKSPDPDDVAFVTRAMEQRVLLVPGSGFGRAGYFRLSYCVDDRVIEGGIEALGKLIGSS